MSTLRNTGETKSALNAHFSGTEDHRVSLRPPLGEIAQGLKGKGLGKKGRWEQTGLLSRSKRGIRVNFNTPFASVST